MAAVLFGALLALDASVPTFSDFWVQHALTTTLLGAAVFAAVAALVIDRLVTARSRRARRFITSSEVKAVADMTWTLVSHPCWLASNLRHPEVRVTAREVLQHYQLFLVSFTHSQGEDPAMERLIRELVQLSFHLEELLVSIDQEDSGNARRVRAFEMQANIDGLAWPHYRDDVVDDYWQYGERFTPQVAELPPEYERAPQPILRTSPDDRFVIAAPDSSTRSASSWQDSGDLHF